MRNVSAAANQTSAGKVRWLPSGTRLKAWPTAPPKPRIPEEDEPTL